MEQNLENMMLLLLQERHGWMFDEITYNAEVWLPGTDSLGNLNGSVRTYGVWTAKNPMNENVIVQTRIIRLNLIPKDRFTK